ncbi:hypothetical protein [Saccharothrix syringae]|uniref:Uncharacterized protein n=1 Tax=Saccharothrix syringae TaxID=103733 RepID=A0A5Q0HD58_SACSY|nr:hypothetical protein [Saccharothrix syringae]QFZ23895.1 hypothetical protein EKG83_46375 [Saccharothrix syringae]
MRDEARVGYQGGVRRENARVILAGATAAALAFGFLLPSLVAGRFAPSPTAVTAAAVMAAIALAAARGD